ncbi:MAG: CDP-diacylglycerol--glycerol-3-phosphate 3-phosphatidyltransferase [Gammaproteobacteria bacterium]|nr:MAG: CDP-diacylglycerol--glycerol-3-phosphate 3-phosphatidyltransferase [Gammaproteobacteria bacterium]
MIKPITSVNVPNLLTLIRIVMIPVIVVVYYLPWEHAGFTAAFIFMVVGFTDWLDGYLARKWDQSTPFGAFLDPVADKLMVAVALTLLVETFDSPAMTLPAMVIIGREIVISALREWMAEVGQRASVAVSYIGKVKTLIQMMAITGLLAFEPWTTLNWIAVVLLYVAAVLTLWSMLVYLRAAWPMLSENMDSGVDTQT